MAVKRLKLSEGETYSAEVTVRDSDRRPGQGVDFVCWVTSDSHRALNIYTGASGVSILNPSCKEIKDLRDMLTQMLDALYATAK